jgi:hypothetical protein
MSHRIPTAIGFLTPREFECEEIRLFIQPIYDLCFNLLLGVLQHRTLNLKKLLIFKRYNVLMLQTQVLTHGYAVGADQFSLYLWEVVF